MLKRVYAVLDEKDRVVKLYADETWARRKAAGCGEFRVVSFVNTDDKQAMELAYDFKHRGTIE